MQSDSERNQDEIAAAAYAYARRQIRDSEWRALRDQMRRDELVEGALEDIDEIEDGEPTL